MEGCGPHANQFYSESRSKQTSSVASPSRQERAESDIDLLIDGKAELEDVIARLGNFEASLRRPVNPTVYSPAEFRTKLTSGSHFLNSVVRADKVFLVGGEAELMSLAK